ncbi:MAG: hypothetical protein JNG85_00260 [Spirochaetaceae bacterium]|nr:hypothetical protein [Spirochaetaceae bacterium]
MPYFVEAAIGTASAAVVGAAIVIVRTLFAMRRDVVGYGVTIKALTLGLRHVSSATRHQNFALQDLGANGSTEKSNACLDKADAVFDGLLADKVGGETR